MNVIVSVDPWVMSRGYILIPDFESTFILFLHSCIILIAIYSLSPKRDTQNVISVVQGY